MSQIFKFLNLPVHETRVIGFDSLQIVLINSRATLKMHKKHDSAWLSNLSATRFILSVTKFAFLFLAKNWPRTWFAPFSREEHRLNGLVTSEAICAAFAFRNYGAPPKEQGLIAMHLRVLKSLFKCSEYQLSQNETTKGNFLVCKYFISSNLTRLAGRLNSRFSFCAAFRSKKQVQLS